MTRTIQIISGKMLGVADYELCVCCAGEISRWQVVRGNGRKWRLFSVDCTDNPAAGMEFTTQIEAMDFLDQVLVEKARNETA